MFGLADFVARTPKPKVAALFIDDSPRGVYPGLVGLERCWGLTYDYDARRYTGVDPVIAHPPCQLWVNLAAVNWKRYKRERPAWYPGGGDDECFSSALANVRRCGGVLEHPAGSHAWLYHGLRMPGLNRSTGKYQRCRPGWISGGQHSAGISYCCEVWQSAYGHPCAKATWLYYCGHRAPFDLDWSRAPGTHQVGWFDRIKPTVSKREASATPTLFALELIRLASWGKG